MDAVSLVLGAGLALIGGMMREWLTGQRDGAIAARLIAAELRSNADHRRGFEQVDQASLDLLDESESLVEPSVRLPEPSFGRSAWDAHRAALARVVSRDLLTRISVAYLPQPLFAVLSPGRVDGFALDLPAEKLSALADALTEYEETSARRFWRRNWEIPTQS